MSEEIKRQMHEEAMSFAQSDVILAGFKEEANGDIVAEWQIMETAECSRCDIAPIAGRLKLSISNLICRWRLHALSRKEEI